MRRDGHARRLGHEPVFVKGRFTTLGDWSFASRLCKVARKTIQQSMVALLRDRTDIAQELSRRQQREKTQADKRRFRQSA